MPICRKCGLQKDAGDFYVYKKTGKSWTKCKSCHVSEGVARAAADPEKHNARSKAWREANPKKWVATVRAWQQRNPEKVEANVKRYQYKIDFNRMWEAQGGLCSCCGTPMDRGGRGKTSVCVDHDRSCCPGRKSCGKCVRGLIHWSCNLVLGYARDNPEVLRLAADYLERSRSQVQPET